MNEQPFDPFGTDERRFVASDHDFAESDAYRLVRIGIYLMFVAYIMLFLLGVILFFIQAELIGPQILPLMQQLFLPAVLITVGILAVGSLLLLGTPKANERKQIKKFLFCYVVVFAIVAFSKMANLGNAAKPIQNIASAYGTYFLIAFFQVLANNRGSYKLLKLVGHLNRAFLILIVGGVGSVALVAVLGLPVWATVTFVLIALFWFFLNWMRTLWTSMSVTKHDHQNEFV